MSSSKDRANLHDGGIFYTVEQTASVNISVGKDGKIGLLVDNGSGYAAVQLRVDEARHIATLISDVCASLGNDEPSA